jgi:hypothetical protein
MEWPTNENITPKSQDINKQLKKDEIEKPLSKDEAHDEANMMNVKLKVDPRFGDIREKHGEKPTAEDYDKALEIVEQMKKMAEEEPLTEKVFSGMSRLAVKAGFGTAEVFGAMAGIGGASGPAEMIDQKKIKVLENLEDASTKLKKLKAEAEEFGKRANLAQKK